LNPRVSSNFLAALISPIFPSFIKSLNGKPLFWNCLATLTTNRKFAFVSVSKATWSPFLILIANSIYTQKRIKKYYRKESVVIYPPAWRRKDENIAGFSEKIKNKFPHQNFFLIVSRLSSYKKIDVAIETFNRMELPLVIIGEGKERKKMEKNAGKNITFFGWANEEELSFAYCHARAFIFPGIDDFGIAPVEAMRRGVPVIAIKKGGAKEIVEDLKTGIFFKVATPEVLADGVRRFCENEEKFDKEYIKNKVQIFSEEVFKQKFLDYVKEVEEKFRFSNSITDKK